MSGGAGLFPRWERYGNTPFMALEESQVFTIGPETYCERIWNVNTKKKKLF
ncbi:MAG: hypothetical protein MZV64_31915 [Ignavibacteriales bacterium]|nr:hypothetical protein [Ignavibacteriales bacterium]